jgi:hypothetical protein
MVNAELCGAAECAAECAACRIHNRHADRPSYSRRRLQKENRAGQGAAVRLRLSPVGL